MGSTSVRQSVCELISAIKPFARFCSIRWPGSWHQVIKKRLFCAYRLSGSRLSAVCLSVWVATIIVVLWHNSSQGIRAPFCSSLLSFVRMDAVGAVFFLLA